MTSLESKMDTSPHFANQFQDFRQQSGFHAVELERTSSIGYLG